jgi:SEC-C motif-containing protein
MRSRYSAFAVGDAAHLLRSWAPATRPDRLELDPDLRWTGLDVLATTGGGLLEQQGTVAFRARAVRRGQREVVEEDSAFVRDEGRWVYLGPVTPAGPPAGR